MELTSLDDIGAKFGTDKSSTGHDYLQFYETFFAPLRNKVLSILEIGVLRGHSLSTWAEYFPQARIIGLDIVPATKRFATKQITIEIADQSDIQQLINVARKHGPFDIIIEDGSHLCEHQITSLRTLFPFVKNNGIYVVEDLQTNYGPMLEQYRGVASITCVEYLKQWLDLRVGDDQIDISKVEDAFLRTYGRSVGFMAFYRRACLIQKQWRASGTFSEPVIEDAIRADSVSVSILAHLALLGDKEEIGFINFTNAANKPAEIQGFSISSEVDALEYKVMYSDGRWSDWVGERTFVGSRGKSEQLLGLAIRVKTDLADQYSVRSICRFKGVSAPMSVLDGEDISSKAAHPLTGLQIDLLRRPGG